MTTDSDIFSEYFFFVFSICSSLVCHDLQIFRNINVVEVGRDMPHLLS